MSHVTHQKDMPTHITAFPVATLYACWWVTHMNTSIHTCECVMSYIWMSHVTRLNESYRTWHTWETHAHTHEQRLLSPHSTRLTSHTYEWVMSHIWMSHVTHMNESCHTYECVGSHMWMNHVTHVDESYHTCEWVMSHMTRMRDTSPHTWTSSPVATLYACSWVTHVNASCRTCEWVTSQHTAIQPNIHCNTAIHYNTLQHAATRSNTQRHKTMTLLHSIKTHCATHCKTT